MIVIPQETARKVDRLVLEPNKPVSLGEIIGDWELAFRTMDTGHWINIPIYFWGIKGDITISPLGVDENSPNENSQEKFHLPGGRVNPVEVFVSLDSVPDGVVDLYNLRTQLDYQGTIYEGNTEGQDATTFFDQYKISGSSEEAKRAVWPPNHEVLKDIRLAMLFNTPHQS